MQTIGKKKLHKTIIFFTYSITMEKDIMKKCFNTIMVILFLCFAGFATVYQTYAEEEPGARPNPWVTTYDESGNPCDIFNLGDKVRILAYSKTTPYDVYVYDPDSVERKHWVSNIEDFDSGLLDDISDKLGDWEVNAGTVSTHFGTAWYMVIPGMPLGVIATLTACFASLGLKRIIGRRK